MATVPQFRIDVDIHDLLMNAAPGPVPVPPPKGLTLPEPGFAQHPEKLSDPGPATIPESRNWTMPQVYKQMRGWLFPLHSFARPAGRFSSHHRVFISRVQVQSRLLVLLGLQQQSQGDD